MRLEEEELLEVVLIGRGQMTYHGEGRVCLGDQRVGGNYAD